MSATIDDTYAEAFRSIYARVLITARDRYWLDMAVQSATGNASSTILCDCEAGLDRLRSAGRDAGRPARCDRAVSRSAIPQGSRSCASNGRCSFAYRRTFSTCPTAAAFNVLPSEREVVPARPQARLLRRRSSVQGRAPRPELLGRADPERRVRDRAAVRLGRRAHGRQPLVLWRNGGRGPRCGHDGRRSGHVRFRA